MHGGAGHGAYKMIVVGGLMLEFPAKAQKLLGGEHAVAEARVKAQSEILKKFQTAGWNIFKARFEPRAGE